MIEGFLNRVRRWNRRRKETNRLRADWKLVATGKGFVTESIFGKEVSTTLEYVYLYENGLGERRVEVTHEELEKQPLVVQFKAGLPLSAIKAGYERHVGAFPMSRQISHT